MPLRASALLLAMAVGVEAFSLSAVPRGVGLTRIAPAAPGMGASVRRGLMLDPAPRAARRSALCAVDRSYMTPEQLEALAEIELELQQIFKKYGRGMFLYLCVT
jgi:hypothetical protein